MKLILSLLLIALAASAQTAVVRVGQANTYTGNFLQDFSAANVKIRAATVATLPSAATSTRLVFLVTDGASAGDCTVGGGSTYNFCTSNGITWINPGDGGGGGGSPTIEVNGTSVGTRSTINFLPGSYGLISGVDTGSKINLTIEPDISALSLIYAGLNVTNLFGASSINNMQAGRLIAPYQAAFSPATAGEVGINSSNSTFLARFSGGPQVLATQSITFQPLTVTATNAGATGTTVNLLAKLNSSNQAVRSDTADTNGAVGVVISGAGTSGTAVIATVGEAACVADNTVTVLDYIIIGSSTAGRCRSAGSTYPTSGQVIGRARTGASAGSTFTVLLFGLGQQGGSGGGGLSSVAREQYFTAAKCANGVAGLGLSGPASNAPTPTCATGTNSIDGLASYSDSATQSLQDKFTFPANLTGNLSVEILSRTSATSGNFEWSLQTACVAPNNLLDPSAWNTTQTVVTAAAGTTLWITSSTIASVTTTGCSGNNIFRFRLFRDPSSGNDTIGAALELISVRFTYSTTT